MTRAPRPVPGRDIRSLPLTPTEAFVFSRIDAGVTERDLVLSTGLSPADVAAALDRLHALGAIDVDAPSSGPSPSQPRASVPAKPHLYDAAELDEDVELSLDRKRAILDLFHRLDDLTYYEILGVLAPASADKKEIKRAYYALAPEFHPDTYFRKRLGSFKQKIETIFSRLTLAHDVLTHKTRRAEYDAYLEQVLRNRAMAAWMERTPRSPTPSASLAPRSEPPPGMGATPSGLSERAAAGKLDHSAAIPERAAATPPPPGRNQATIDPAAAAEIDRIRRQTLARKLSGGFRRSSTSGVMTAVSGGAPPSSPGAGSQPPAPAGAPLRSQGSTSRAPSIQRELERCLAAADIAAARSDFASLADALRAALAIAPEDRVIQERHREAQERATRILAEGYLKQADYEASEGRWTEASWSYAKAASLLPNDARPHERVAFATLVMGGSRQRAIEFAWRAVDLEPGDASLRLTLARAYMAAGHEPNALAEIEEARRLAAGDAEVEAVAAELTGQARRHGRVM
jgi:curved DNA-binding protein CbpA